MEKTIIIEQRTHPKAKIALLILALAWLLQYFEIIINLPGVYWNQQNNRYCILAILLATILAFSKRSEILVTNLRTSQLGLFALFILNLIFTYFSIEGNVFLQQATVIMMIPAMVLTVIGREATQVLSQAILLIMCAIPAGEILSATLPKFYSHLLETRWLNTDSLFKFENGSLVFASDKVEFKIIVSSLLKMPIIFVIGIFTSRFIFPVLWIQLIFAILLLLLPAVLSYFFLGIYLSSEFLPKLITINNLEFIISAITVMGIGLGLLVGLWFKQTINFVEDTEEVQYHSDFLELHWLRPVIISYCIFFIVPWVGGAYQDIIDIKESKEIALIPPKITEWEGPLNVEPAIWFPHFPYSRASFVKAYQKSGLRVQFFTAYVGREMEQGSLLNPNNNLYIKQRWNVVSTNYLKVNIVGYKDLSVREELLENTSTRKLIWSWYYIGRATESKPYIINALDSVSYLTQGYRHSGIIAVAIDNPGNVEFGRRNLTIFINSLSPYLPKIIDPIKKHNSKLYIR